MHIDDPTTLAGDILSLFDSLEATLKRGAAVCLADTVLSEDSESLLQKISTSPEVLAAGLSASPH